MIVAALLALQGSAYADDEAPLVLSVQRLSLDAALTVAQGAVAHCREQGV